MNTSNYLLEDYSSKKISKHNLKLLSYYNGDVPAYLSSVIGPTLNKLLSLTLRNLLRKVGDQQLKSGYAALEKDLEYSNHFNIGIEVEEMSRDFFSLNWEKFQQILEHPNFSVSHFGWWYLYQTFHQVKNQVREFFQMHYWRGLESHVFRHMIHSQYAAALIAEHCKDLLKWLTWQPQTLLYVLQKAAKSLQMVAQRIFIQAAKIQFWEYLPLIAQLENRNEILAQTLPEASISHTSPWHFQQMLHHQDNWVKNIACNLQTSVRMSKSFI